MINEPLFENDIIPTILRNFNNYFFGQIWYVYVILLGMLMYAAYRQVCKKSCSSCRNLFPGPVAGFDPRSPKDLSALLFLLISFAIYGTVTLMQDDSLFNNPDLMSLNTIRPLNDGIPAFYGIVRMCPISFFDLNALYAATHNFNIINIYILIKQGLILWLFYRFLNFLSPARRLSTIGIIQLVPAVFWLNNIIFPEQNIIIFILASLLCLRNFSNGRQSGLWGFTVFTLLAIYSKETVVLFYGGILMFAVLYDVYCEKIKPNDFLHPFRLSARLPVETMIFLCCLSFAIFYLFNTIELKDNVYIVFRQTDLDRLLKLYKFEIVIIILAWLIAVKKFLYREKFDNPVCNEGLLFGASFTLAVIIFKLRVAPIFEHLELKSYYALLADIFGIIYIARNIRSPRWLGMFFGIILLYSWPSNLTIAAAEAGKARREAAEFLSSVIRRENHLSYMLSEHTGETDWIKENWNAALLYYHPDAELILKMPTLAQDNIVNKFSQEMYAQNKKYLSTIKGEDIPVSGDYFVIRTNAFDKDIHVIKDIPHDLVFENKLFRIYKIK